MTESIARRSPMGCEEWALPNGKIHRLLGPARIWPQRTFEEFPSVEFWLNDIYYYNVFHWLKNHPNQNEEFQNEMKSKWGNY